MNRCRDDVDGKDEKDHWDKWKVNRRINNKNPQKSQNSWWWWWVAWNNNVEIFTVIFDCHSRIFTIFLFRSQLSKMSSWWWSWQKKFYPQQQVYPSGWIEFFYSNFLIKKIKCTKCISGYRVWFSAWNINLMMMTLYRRGYNNVYFYIQDNLCIGKKVNKSHDRGMRFTSSYLVHKVKCIFSFPFSKCLVIYITMNTKKGNITKKEERKSS